MRFTLNEEQTQLQDSVRRWVQKNYNFQQRQAIERSAEGVSRAHWATMAELGWLAAAFPEEVGGMGGSTIEAAIIAEELGRALVLEPFLACGVLAAEALNWCGTDAQRAELLPAMLAGESMVVLAHAEQEAGGEVGFVATRAEQTDGGWRLHGCKNAVIAAPLADRLLISARTAGEPDDTHGMTLFLLPAAHAGLVQREFRTTDGQRAADVLLQDALVTAADVIGDVGGALPGLRTAHARAIAVLCAEAVGVMDQALWTTRDYLRTRRQFGVAIGSFQVLQHRAADMYVAVEQARAAMLRALAHIDDEDADRRDEAAAAAKVQVGRSGDFVCGQAIQLHGGIGVTAEYVIGHHYKRMLLLQQLLGHPEQHLRHLAARLAQNE
ncbi:MAG TPA: acyl-CoA dehydrogenase family protein [Acetobacteraceae bacterium]|nr:acyl-CoA dehydrogenase family protein [Acetobacteraceae bacterium]